MIFFSFFYFIWFFFFLSKLNDFDTFQNSIWNGVFRNVWIFQLFVLSFISYLKWVLSIAEEKNNKTLDFITITNISPIRFILWKFVATVFFIMLLFIISLPYLAIWLLIWWVSISDVWIYAMYTTSYITFSVIAGMFISSLARNSVYAIVTAFSSSNLIVLGILFMFIHVMYLRIDTAGSVPYLYAFFPSFLIWRIEDQYTSMMIFWTNFHFTALHISFFVLFFLFFLVYLIKKYTQITFPRIKVYSYFQSFILFLILLLFSQMSSNGLFLFMYFFLIINSFMYIYNDDEFKRGKLIWNYIYILIVSLLSIALIIFLQWFHASLFLFYIIVVLFIFNLHLFLRTHSSANKWVISIYSLIVLSLFFYIVPAVTTNLLGTDFFDISEVFRSIVYDSGFVDFDCLWEDNANYCQKIQRVSILKYLIFYSTSSFLLFLLWLRKSFSSLKLSK